VSNTSKIIPGEVVSELLYSEVDEEITIPRVIRRDEKEMFIREVSIDGRVGSIRRKCHNEFDKEKGFLALGCGKFEVVLLKDDDPSRKFSIDLLKLSKYCIGLESATTLVVRSRM
jgi:hypothetical protein